MNRSVLDEERRGATSSGSWSRSRSGERGGEAPRLTLHVHLAPGTTGVDLATLVGQRLRSMGIKTVATPDSGNLWVEGTMYAHLRLGGGLRAEIAGGGTAVARDPPAHRRWVGQALRVDVTTVIRPSGELPVRGAASLVIPLGMDSSAASISAELARAGRRVDLGSSDGHLAPRSDVQRRRVTGFSMGLRNEREAWRVELRL